MNKQENITLSILGKNLDSIRLDELNLILQSYQRMLDRSYRAYYGNNNTKPPPRDKFHAKTQPPKSGSIIIELTIHAPDLWYPLYKTVGIGLSIASEHPISEMMKTVISFYKTKSELKQNNRRDPEVISIDSKGDNNININQMKVSGGNIYIIPAVKNGADMMEEPVRKICRCMQRQPDIDEINSYSKSEKPEGFSITRDEANMLHPETEQNEDEEQMSVKIFRFDANSGHGRLRIIKSETIPEGEKLSFNAAREKNLYDKIIDAMHDSVKESEITATKDFIHHPSGKKTIDCLHIKSIK